MYLLESLPVSLCGQKQFELPAHMGINTFGMCVGVDGNIFIVVLLVVAEFINTKQTYTGCCCPANI